MVKELVSTNHFMIKWVHFLSLMNIVVVRSQQPVSKLSTVGLWRLSFWISCSPPPLQHKKLYYEIPPKNTIILPPIFDLLLLWLLLALWHHHGVEAVVLLQFFGPPSMFSSCSLEQHAFLLPIHSY